MKSLKCQFNKEIPKNMDGVVSLSLINDYFGKDMDDFGQVSICYLFLSPISTDSSSSFQTFNLLLPLIY